MRTLNEMLNIKIEEVKYKKCKSSRCKQLIVDEEKNKYCSKRCLYHETKVDHKSEAKIKACEYLGNKCKRCGLDDIRVLCFHHVNPLNKMYEISTSFGKKFEELKLELDKCIVLCSNCHLIVHAEKDPKYIQIHRLSMGVFRPQAFGDIGYDRIEKLPPSVKNKMKAEYSLDI